MIWKPNVTVAAVIEREGKFLLVEEDQQDLGVQLNQPAGHLEPSESIIQGCIRETLEEIQHRRSHHRSPLVLRCIEDYLAGKRYPLSIITHQT